MSSSVKEREDDDMKNKKFFAGVICVMAIGLSACANKDDTSGAQTLQQEQIRIEAASSVSEEAKTQDPEHQETENHEQERSTTPDVQSREEQKSEIQQSETPVSKDHEQNDTDAELEEKLAQYRAEREGMTNVAMGNGVSGYGAPNAENYGFQDTADYMQNYDSRELNKAFETAKKYVEETLAISVETNAVVYACVDQRITEIYEATDKGVANGYDAENIFVCEYCDNGTWQYLILVRDGKDSDWSVIHHGSSYKN